MSTDFDDNLEESASILVQSSSFLVNYGWYFVGLGIFYLVFKEKINQFLDEWYEKREESKYAAKYHKNPDLARARSEGLEAARQRMQEEVNRKAIEAEIRRKELEEKRRLEKLNKLIDTGGNRLGEASTSKNFKSEYNPLMNDAGGRYKPPKRSCCKKGGGCG